MIDAGIALHVVYALVPGELAGTNDKVVDGYLGGFATLMTNENLLKFKTAPDARLYNLETMEYMQNVNTPQEAIDACNDL